MAEITVTIRYFEMLGEKSGCQKETIQTSAITPRQLYRELQSRHGFTFTTNIVKAVVNDEFADWDVSLKDGDTVAFLPPFSGG